MSYMDLSEKQLEKLSKMLKEKADEDPFFAVSLSNPGKNIVACGKYIIKVCMKNKETRFYDDDEILGMAAHYYIESKESLEAEFKNPATAPSPKSNLSETVQNLIDKNKVKQEAPKAQLSLF